MLLHGRCHCGNIAYTLNWEPSPSEIPARACSCSFCTKHGGVWTACPEGRLRLSIKDPGQVSRYSFGTRTAEFHVCARCGVVPAATSDIEGRLYAVVNVNTLEDLDPALLRRAAADFEGESEEARLARRVRNWIGQVEFDEGSG
ncbi:MAG: hypothetical protein HYV16_10910 [Gammaproteobacteria bacterium]|nr:hypothetical protein [Gammaproteobacteria bacterium]